jgi:hypothetical protein
MDIAARRGRILRNVEIFRAIRTGQDRQDVSARFALGEPQIKLILRQVGRIESGISQQKQQFPDGWKNIDVREAGLSFPSVRLLRRLELVCMQDVAEFFGSIQGRPKGRLFAELHDWFLWTDIFWNTEKTESS